MNIFIAEIVGTAMLVMFGNGVVANHLLAKTKGHGTGWMLITTGWGLAVAISVYSVGRISGAHLNPAVTLGLWSIQELDAAQVPIYLAGELLGAMIGAIIVWGVYISHWQETKSADEKLAVFCTGPAIRATIPNFFSEFIGTAALIFGILAIAANSNEIKGTDQLDLTSVFSSGIQPLLVGFLVWMIGMALGGTTGYAINPARDLGPRIVHAVLPIPGKRDSDWSYAWIPIAGPIAGGMAGAILFRMFDSLSNAQIIGS